MALPFPRVQAGQIIKAEFVNSVLDEVERLDRRLSALETTGGGTRLVLYDVEPRSPLRVGQRVTVLGANFLVPGRINEVDVDGVPVPQSRFKDNSDVSHLIFDIPEFGVPTGGKDTTIHVKNQNGEGSIGIRLLPEEVVAQGRIELDYTSPPIMSNAEPNIGAATARTYVFVLTLRAFVSQDSTYQVNHSINATGWQTAFYQENADAARPSNQLSIPADTSGAGVPRELRIAVTVPANPGTTTGTLRVEVVEMSGGNRVIPRTTEVAITAGSPPPMPATGARVSGRTAQNATVVGPRLRFTAGQPGSMALNMRLERVGFFTFTATVRAPAAGWTLLGPDPPSLNVQAATDQPLDFIISADTTAGATDLVVTVTSTNANPPVSATYIQPIGR